MHALQVARNARAHFHCMDGFQAARELIAVANLLADNLSYGHFHWGLSFGFSRTGTGTPSTKASERCEADD